MAGQLNFLPVTIQYLVLCCVAAFFGCKNSEPQAKQELPSLYVVVLGIAQDAGYPQADCRKDCCSAYWNGSEKGRYATSLAIVDSETKQSWLVEATPDFKYQLRVLNAEHGDPSLEGILLTHAHIGHYSGLMHLGKEVMGSEEIPVYVMPRMNEFLSNHGPWSQLVSDSNITLNQLKSDSTIELSTKVSVTPIQVPHRDEYSETVGFKIAGPNKELLFIPDIDKWEKWDRDILEEIKLCDYALLDGTFNSDAELPHRNMNEIPHPFIKESMGLFRQLESEDRAKVHFIHFNHTNKVMRDSHARNHVLKAGFFAAEQGQFFEL